MRRPTTYPPAELARLIAEVEYRASIARWHGIESSIGGGFRTAAPPAARRRHLRGRLLIVLLAVTAAIAAAAAAPAAAQDVEPPPAAEPTPLPTPEPTPTPTPTPQPAPASPAPDLWEPPEAKRVAITPAQAAVIAQGERLALDYARAAGWHDSCSGRPIRARVWANLDAIAGFDVAGVAFPTLCLYAIDPSATSKPAELCRVAVHERLHLIRHDPGHGWHPDEAGHPLDAGARPYPPCVALYPQAATPTRVADARDGRVTLRQARRALRGKLGRRWRLYDEGGYWDGGRRTEVMVKAVRPRARCKRRGGHLRCKRRRLVRFYRVTRATDSAPLTVRRGH